MSASMCRAAEDERSSRMKIADRASTTFSVIQEHFVMVAQESSADERMPFVLD